MVYRMVGERQVHDRDSPYTKGAVVNFGLAADVYNYSPRVKCPLGTRKFAGGDSAVVHHVMFRPVLVNHLASECERIGRGQDHPATTITSANGAGYVVESSFLGFSVVRPVAGFHMLIIGPAIQHDVPCRDDVASCRVIGNLISSQNIVAEVNLNLTTKLEN